MQPRFGIVDLPLHAQIVGEDAVSGDPLCLWQATVVPDPNRSPWILVVSPASPVVGNASLVLAVSENYGPARAGTVNVGGKLLSISQAAATACVGGFVAYSTHPSFCATGGDYLYSGLKAASCPVDANLLWLIVKIESCGWTPASGAYEYVVRFSATPNFTGVLRTATATVGGVAYLFTQGPY